MTRRDWLCGVAALPAAASAPTGPNVIVVVLDDLGNRDLGFQGAADLKTPNIDALAASGVAFTNWYSNAPVCAPARASIMSGRFPAKAGVPNNGGELTPGIPTLGSVARSRGYRTAAIGKWHLGHSDATYPNGHGFDYFYGFHNGCVDYYSHRFYWGEPKRVNYHDLWRNRDEVFDDGRYLTERITEEAVSFIRREQRNPFLAYVAYNAPHYPMHAPEKYVRRFVHLPLERRIYAAMIAAVDDGVGEIRRVLSETGRLDDTLIFLVGDNGATTEKRAGLNQEYAAAGDNGVYRGFKFSLFDGGMHVPAVMSWPARFRGGVRTGEVVMSMDILPTVCRAIGATASGMDGSDILDVAVGTAKSPHEAIYWNQGGQLAVRKGRWKLVINGRTFDRSPEGSNPLPGDDAMFLSNLESDPQETKNLRRLHPNLADELATLAARWKESLPKP
ncbi:MAG: sulfatase-like hydrolase/transferase [Bryobacteraceae bacterium]